MGVSENGVYPCISPSWDDDHGIWGYQHVQTRRMTSPQKRPVFYQRWMNLLYGKQGASFQKFGCVAMREPCGREVLEGMMLD